MQTNECMYICDQFTEYHDHTLAPEIRAKVDTHLSICQTCQKTFNDLASLVQNLNQLPKIQTSQAFAADLMQVIQSAEQPSIWHSVVRSSYFKLAGYAIAAGLVVALGLNVWLDPVASPKLSSPQRFTTEQKIQTDTETALAATLDSADSQAVDSLEFQQSIKPPSQSLQLVNSSK